MSADGVALAAIVILLFPMGYFLLASPAFLLVKPDIPPVTQLLRGMFNAHFLMMRIAAIIGTVTFALTGRPISAVCRRTGRGFCDVARGLASAEVGHRTQRPRCRRCDGAVRRLRRLHWVGMLCNAILLIAVIASIPYVSTTAT